MQPPPPNYSNYYGQPVYGQGYPTPPGPPEVSFDVLGQAWTMNFQDLGTWLPAGLVYLIVAGGIGFFFNLIGNLVLFGSLTYMPPPGRPLDLGSLYMRTLELLPFSLVGGGFAMPMIAGFYNMGVKRLSGEPISVGDLFQGYSRFGPLFVLGIVLPVVQYVGLLLLIVPGIYLSGALSFAPLICLRQNKGPFEAMSLSLQTLRGGQGFMMFLLVFVSAIVAAAGVILCCVGIILTIPIVVLVISITYYNFFPPQISQAPYGAPPPWEVEGYGMAQPQPPVEGPG